VPLLDIDCRNSQTQDEQISNARRQRRTAQQAFPRVDVPHFLKQLDELIKAGRIEIGRGHTGRVYLSYFDERYPDNPFRC
jgi:maltooligosyltrehalose synthase